MSRIRTLKNRAKDKGIALLFLQPQRQLGEGGHRHAPGHSTSGKDPVPIVQEAGWAPRPVGTGAKIPGITGIRSPGPTIP
jgi:hypothetical protein